MSLDKEREIQLQFLEEAQEYLDTIESVLLGLAGNHIDGQQMDAVLRAAHSVKGGAGMMGYSSLSQLAHRLEDSFKVLKVQRNSIVVDGSLESLLLEGVDRLRQVLRANRQGSDVDTQWLETKGNPVFEQLRERLGDPVADDASSMLGADDGTNVTALLFETEVDGCLARLESVLADPNTPCLEEEVSIMAQELGGLGEMLQLEAFTQLCESVIHHLTNAPEAVREITQLALNAWRRSQALVLVGQVSSLPNAINWVSSAPAVTSATPITSTEALAQDWLESSVAAEFDQMAAFSESSFLEMNVQAEPLFAATTHSEIEQPEEVFAALESDSLETTPTEVLAAHDRDEVVAAEFDFYQSLAQENPESVFDAVPEAFAIPQNQAAEVTVHAQPLFTEEVPKQTAAFAEPSVSLSRDLQPTRTEVPANDVTWRKEKASKTGATTTQDSQENSVRIPIRQLDRLNDLFGELTIERNGLGLHLDRLRSLIETLNQKVSTLEQSNMRLRTAYDTVATQSAVYNRDIEETRYIGGANPRKLLAGSGYPPSRSPSLPAATGNSRSTVNSQADWSSANSGDDDNRHHTPDRGHLERFDVLEMDRYSDLHLLSMEVMETIVQIQEVTSDISLSLEDTDSTARELNQTAKQLQTNLTRVRMRPLSDLVGRFSRALRDLSLQYGKQVELKVLGKGTLVDRSILEAMSDPLMHLVRNAFDHGIEEPAKRTAQGKPAQGVIEIKAAHRGSQTIITVSDDGNGINLNKIRAKAEAMGLDAGLLAAASEDELLSLIFEPGFSTADQVTALSGRGVGMDVVRNNLKQIRGDIRVDTQPGRGTTFTLTVPFTLSVARVLLVESNGMLLAFPNDVIEEMLLLRPEQVLKTPGSEVLNWEGEMVPLIRLGANLTFYCPRRAMTLEGIPSISEPTVLMVSQGDQLVGLQVDRCWGEREVAVRQVGGSMALPIGFSSCAILGDGKVVPIVDVNALLPEILGETRPTWSQQKAVGREDLLSAAPMNESSHPIRQELTPYRDSPPTAYPQSQKQTILVVDDSINVRRFLALALEKAGYLVEQAKDGQDAVERLLSGLQVSAVICDIEMPRLDGYGFLARIKSDVVFSDLPIAMLTSRSGDKHRQLAMTLGASAYFSKPYNERELLKTMSQLMNSQVAYSPQPVV